VPICAERAWFLPAPKIACEVCGRPLAGPTPELGSRWIVRPAEGSLWQAILLLKHGQMEPLAADLVVPVPLHRQRERESAYNSAGPGAAALLTAGHAAPIVA